MLMNACEVGETSQSEVLCHRIRGKHHSSIVEVDCFYLDLLSVNTAGAVTRLPKETRRVQSYLECRACSHVETAAWWLAGTVPRKLDVDKWWL